MNTLQRIDVTYYTSLLTIAGRGSGTAPSSTRPTNAAPEKHNPERTRSNVVFAKIKQKYVIRVFSEIQKYLKTDTVFSVTK
jgi:hypothetical protein